MVSVMLADVRVTSGFRAALFAACGRSGVSINEFLIKAAAEMRETIDRRQVDRIRLGAIDHGEVALGWMAAVSLNWLKGAFATLSSKLDNPMFLKGLENLQANVAATQPAAAAQSVSTTMTDNRPYPVTINSTVNQTVTQATQATAAAAQATARAMRDFYPSGHRIPARLIDGAAF